MKFQLGETVYSLHFDKHQFIYLQESVVIGTKTQVIKNTFTETVSKLIVEDGVNLIQITFDDDAGKYVISEDEDDYLHPLHLVFRNKQEALFYLHGIVSDIAK